MPTTPDYVTWLRSHVGHQKIILVRACGIVADGQGRVLLRRHPDFGWWGLLAGQSRRGLNLPAQSRTLHFDKLNASRRLATPARAAGLSYEHGGFSAVRSRAVRPHVVRPLAIFRQYIILSLCSAIESRAGKMISHPTNHKTTTRPPFQETVMLPPPPA